MLVQECLMHVDFSARMLGVARCQSRMLDRCQCYDGGCKMYVDVSARLLDVSATILDVNARTLDIARCQC